MRGQTHGGKGSAPRSVDKRKFDEAFDRIFKTKEAPADKTTKDKQNESNA